MALIACPDCGRKVSDKAIACPDCACPIADTQNASRALLDAGPLPVTKPASSGLVPTLGKENIAFDKEQAVADLFALRIGLQDICEKINSVNKDTARVAKESKNKVNVLWDNVRKFKDEYMFSSHLGFGGVSGSVYNYYAKSDKFFAEIWKAVRGQYLTNTKKKSALEFLDDLFNENLTYEVDYSRINEKSLIQGFANLKEIEAFVSSIDEKSAIFYNSYEGLKLNNEYGYGEARQRFVFNTVVVDTQVFEKTGKYSTEKQDMKNKKPVVKRDYDPLEVRAYYAAIKSGKDKFIKLMDPFKAILKHCLSITAEIEKIESIKNSVESERKSKFPKIARQYSDLVMRHTIIHESDFGATDYIIYLFITNRCDTMEETLQTLDIEKNNDRIETDIEEAVAYIERNLFYIINNLGKKFTKALSTHNIKLSMEYLAQLQKQMIPTHLIVENINNAKLASFVNINLETAGFEKYLD